MENIEYKSIVTMYFNYESDVWDLHWNDFEHVYIS